MPQKTLTGEDVPEENEFWADSSFAETISDEEWELKKRTFAMKHTEEMNYNCKQCSGKMSAHNKDWHAGLCDRCFDKEVEENEVLK